MEHQLLMLEGVAEHYIVLVDLDHLGELVVVDLVDMVLMEQILDNLQELLAQLTLEEVVAVLKELNQDHIQATTLDLLEATAVLVSSSLLIPLRNK
jgi:hypothetical protein